MKDNLEELKRLCKTLDAGPKGLQTAVLYVFANQTTGQYYIGYTERGELYREKEHLYHLSTGKHQTKTLQDAFDLNPEFRVVAIIIGDPMHLWQLEKMFIHKYRGDPKLLNIQGAVPYSEERLRIMSEKASLHRHSNETKARIKEITKKQWSSEENRQQQSERRKKFFAEGGFKYQLGIKRPEAFGQKVSKTKRERWAAKTEQEREEYSRKRTQSFVRAVIIDGVRYDSIILASKALGVSTTTVRNRIGYANYPSWNYA